jgi:thiol:disulfide interchange protein DsbD
MRKLFCFLLLLVTTQAHALKQEPLLPDQAFQFKAEVVSPTTIKATWDIAEGHYLARQFFKFETETEGVSLTAPVIPAGEPKEDATLGKQEIYRDKLELEIPVERGDLAQAVQLALKVRYQGCSDAGLCYPPIRKTADLQLAAANTGDIPVIAKAETNPSVPAAEAEPKVSGLPAIFKNTGKQTANNVLPVDDAFAFDITAIDQGTFKATWIVQPKHHLYRPKITFSLKEPQEGVTLGKPVFPIGKQVKDEYFGTIEVYDSDIEVKVPFQTATAIEKLVVTTQYQGCSDTTGVCYPPVKKTNELNLTGLPAAQPITLSDATTTTDTKLNEQDALAQRLEGSSFFQKILIMFIAGLLLAFTPCIFPMIPILSGIIAGSGNTSSRKAFFLSLTYVLAGAFAYAVIGFVFGFFGQNLQTVLQNPVAIGLMSLLFVLLALSMFGFYDLQLPNNIQSRLSEISNKQESGSFVGAAIMGFLSTLIVGPCAGPVIAGALTYIAQSKDAVLGASALFSMGIGIGIPLLLIGMSAGHLLPRAGAWMDTVKAVFGIIMLGIAIYMLSRIVPLEVTMALTGILLVSSGVYMGALEKTNEEAGGWGRFWKSTGMIQLFYGALILLGLAAGSQNLLQPLKGVFGSTIITNGETPASQGLQFQAIKGIDGLNVALATAKAENRPVMLDFTADFCVSCAKMERTTFKSADVVNAFGNTLLLKADVSKQDDADVALQKKFDVIGPPAFIFFNNRGEEMRPLRLVGEMDAESLTKHAKQFMQQATKL